MSVLAIHGGCGVMPLDAMTDEEWHDARCDLARALKAGWQILSAGGTAVDAVQAAVVVMEDSAHFNAGHGAALNADGEHELDAAIMDGCTLAAGAVAGARAIRNPIRAAKALMEDGRAVMLGGASADRFADEVGLPLEPQTYFTTPRRVEALEAMRRHAASGTSAREDEKHGTVGAVALDAAGHLAAATSTGGYTMKPAGRIGDSPVIGAGTYAQDGRCAVSGTGKGEFFIRHAVGHDLVARIAYRGDSLIQAANAIIHDDLAPHAIGAGLIAVSADGAVAAPYNTAGMFRGWVLADGTAVVATHDQTYAVNLTTLELFAA